MLHLNAHPSYKAFDERQLSWIKVDLEPGGSNTADKAFSEMSAGDYEAVAFTRGFF